MRNLFIVACLMSVGFDSMATVGNHIFICNVAKVGKDQVQLACDPKNPKMVMKTPRKWLDPEDKVALKSKAKLFFCWRT